MLDYSFATFKGSESHNWYLVRDVYTTAVVDYLLLATNFLYRFDLKWEEGGEVKTIAGGGKEEERTSSKREGMRVI